MIPSPSGPVLIIGTVLAVIPVDGCFSRPDKGVIMTMKYKIFTVALAIAASAACGNTMRGAKTDTEIAAEKTAAGIETFDVKAALIADGRVDAGNINVDTIASTKTVVLKGSVPTAEQRSVAERIAREQAKGYTVNNTLTVAPK